MRKRLSICSVELGRVWGTDGQIRSQIPLTQDSRADVEKPVEINLFICSYRSKESFEKKTLFKCVCLFVLIGAWYRLLKKTCLNVFVYLF
jgi:hypothetical protein